MSQTQTIALLDTPKKKSLQIQSTQLRVALKDFERIFANSHDGRKPSKDDIKLDTDIAGKYKEYNRVRDVLSGKLDYETFLAPPTSPVRKRSSAKVNGGDVAGTQRDSTVWATPRKRKKSSEDQVPDDSNTATPIPSFPITIGPTPQRNGQALGLFDLLSNPASSHHATPSTGRKRKLEEDTEVLRDAKKDTIAQTPSGRRNRAACDLLDHLTGGPDATPETGHRRHGRTPVSEGRRFMLSQFFATPNTKRFSDIDADAVQQQHTSLTKDEQLQATPRQIPAPRTLDATPAYLKRSTSFKDRLLSSVSAPKFRRDSSQRPSSPQEQRQSQFPTGPPTLRHFKSITRSSSQIFTEQTEPPIRDINSNNHHDNSDDDDLDALREIESNSLPTKTLVKDSQPVTAPPLYYNSDDDNDQFPYHSDDDLTPIDNRLGSPSHANNPEPLSKPWKKKGQKRTTKQAKIKPGHAPLPAPPKFVVAEDPESESDTDDDADDFLDADSDDGERDENTKRSKTITNKQKKEKKIANDEGKTGSKATKSTTGTGVGTINPNAASHMNFRSLKIRNRNPKAKGKGRFGGGRKR